MQISFFRGDDHQVRFNFKDKSVNPEKVFFTVKCEKGIVRMQKQLNQGITFEEGYYYITFIPADTEKLSCELNMTYDIQIIVQGKKYTVAKDDFIIEEDITTPDCEV